MAIGFFTHSDMLDHRPGAGHPERPERLKAVADALGDASDLELETLEAPLAEEADLERVHPKAYVRRLFEAVPTSGRNYLDPDTALSPGSLTSARRAHRAEGPFQAPSGDVAHRLHHRSGRAPRRHQASRRQGGVGIEITAAR